MTRRVFILGGGPCGLALAYDLSRQEIPVTLIEADTQLGGLAKSISWGASKMDLGPHKLFTLDHDLWKKVQQMLPEGQWIEHPKISQIFLHQNYLAYPPTPVDLWKTFGLLASMACARDLAGAQLRFGRAEKPEKSIPTFASDAQRRVGKRLYNLFFKPLASKIWGDPETLDEGLSKSRIQVPSVSGVIAGLFKSKSGKDWQAHQYHYPRGGLCTLWDVMARKIREKGGEIILGDPLVSIETRAEDQIARLQTRGGRHWDVQAGSDWVISTIPLSRTAKLLKKSPPDRVLEQIGKLQLNDLFLVFLKVKEDVLGKNAWVFVPDPKVIFHRLSGQRKFDPGMVEEGLHLLCCEVMSYPGKEAATLSDSQLVERCVDGLVEMRCLKERTSVVDSLIIRLPKSYPVMTAGYRAVLNETLAYFDRFKNLRTIGRQGAYNYIGSLDAMDTGFGMAKLLIDNRVSSPDWSVERQRTAYYPILD